MKTKYVILAVFLQTGSLFAAITADWKGASGGIWTLTTNWVNGVPPNAIGDIANFKNSPPAAGGTVTLDAAFQTVGQMNFDLGTGYTISPMAPGDTLRLNNTPTSALITITNANGNGAHTIATDLLLQSSLTIDQGSTGNFTISGIISDFALGKSITKLGANVLVLSGPGNTYTGGTIINAGTVSVVSATDNQLGPLGVGGVTIGTATLQFVNAAALASTRGYSLAGAATIDTTAAAFSVTISPPGPSGITGAGSLTKVGAGTLILNTTNTYLGGTTINAGEVDISNDANLGNASGALHIGTAILRTTAAITSARSGSFTGSPSTIETAGQNSSFSGNFSGPGTLAIQGGGTIQFTGTNSYSGGTNLIGAGTTLTGTTNGIQGDINLAAGTFLTFDQSFNGTYAGAVSGAGATLTKTGTGTVQITGNSTFSGPTNINQGTLNVNGSLTASAVAVSSGTTLSGSGTVGNTTSNGTIDPGNGTSVGTLNVGSLTLLAGSTVNISIAPLSSDRIAATGAAMLTGALTVEPTPGFYGFNACYTIVTSPAVTPGFAPVTSLNSAFVPTVTYTATTAELCVVITRPFAVFPFSNANTKAVGDNIDALNAAGVLSPDLTSVFNSFIGQSFATINNALDQMHPAPYSAFTELQTEVGGQLISLFHRMPYLPCACSNPNRLWIEPFANSLTLKEHGMQIGSQSNSGGIAMGYDREATDNLVLGIGGAWNRSKLEWYEHRGHGEVDGFYAGLYGDYLIGQFYIGGSFLAGMDFYNTSRHLEFVTTDRHATASYSALDIMAQISTAYLFGSPLAFFYPYANFDFLYLRTHQFNESGAGGLNLNVHQRSDSTLRTEMGLALQVQDINAAETFCISPKVSLGWVNMCPLDRPMYKSTFEGEPIPFSVRGWDETWNLLNVDFALAFAYRCFSLRLEYNVETSANSGTTLYNQHGNARFDWKW